jgi:hypothetical protein
VRARSFSSKNLVKLNNFATLKTSLAEVFFFMKVAILGHNPVGLELALFFDQIGAAVVWMGTNSDLDRYDSFCRPGFNLSSLTGEQGLARLGKTQEFSSFEDYFQK